MTAALAVAPGVGISAYSDPEKLAILALYGERQIAAIPLMPVCFIDRTASVDDTARVHAFAVVQAGATIGPRSVLWNGARILPHAVIEADVMIGGGTEIGIGSTVGEGSRIQANCFFPAHSVIGSHVFVGPGVVCTDDRYPRVPDAHDPPYMAEPPIIEDDVSIGAGAVLCPGVRIGRGACIAAGAVVTTDVAGLRMAIGLPAESRPLPLRWTRGASVAADGPSPNAVRDSRGDEISFP